MSAKQRAAINQIVTREKMRERESSALVYLFVACAFVGSISVSFVCGAYSVKPRETLEDQPKAVRDFAREYKRLTR